MVSELDVQTDGIRSKQPLFMVFTLCCMLWTILGGSGVAVIVAWTSLFGVRFSRRCARPLGWRFGVCGYDASGGLSQLYRTVDSCCRGHACRYLLICNEKSPDLPQRRTECSEWISHQPTRFKGQSKLQGRIDEYSQHLSCLC
jgi:hypothetical protein